MIVACTGHVEEAYIQKAWTHEIDEVIPKPVKPEVLREILQVLIWNSQTTPENKSKISIIKYIKLKFKLKI